ncbi:hypothetical protein [Marinomonas fungiae]|uniref:Uncharacterized protein n=1 Tax=Marinomonas fungiae TaxID=1137284 RepID=A0A0K6IQK0_9GAMM|nr:hypothetical protein [Marinomonas fungiae]CUB05374.1 hypothetical protein Ga0061065_11080 [Marinomonas fungiae]
MTDTLTNLFPEAPLEAIPTSKGKAPYVVLKMLADGQLLERDELTKVLGETWRWGLQQLRGDRFGYWLIHSIKKPNSRFTVLQLDPRHLSGDAKQDAAARLEARRKLKRTSHKEAVLGGNRVPKAYTEMLEANAAYFKNLGEAANDSMMGDEY